MIEPMLAVVLNSLTHLLMRSDIQLPSASAVALNARLFQHRL
jgi:hypothetical protein